MNILKPQKQSKPVGYAIIILTVILIISCFTTACQKADTEESNLVMATPTPTAVIPDSNDYSAEIEQMSVFLSPSKPASSHISETWSKTKEFEDIKIKVKLDIDEVDAINLPKIDIAVEAEITENTFDLDFAKDAVNYFLGDTYYFPQRTKKDAEQQLANFMECIVGISFYDSESERVDKYLDSLNKAIDELPTEEIDGENMLIHFTNNGSLSLKSYDENGQKSNLHIDNFDGLQNSSATLRYSHGKMNDNYQELGMHSIRKTDRNHLYDNNFMYRALSQANDAVNQMTDNMELSHVFIGKEAHSFLAFKYSNYDLYAKSDRICLSFIYTRVTSNIPTLVSQKTKDIELESDLFAQLSSADVEYIRVVVDEDGIASFYWLNKTAPSNITEHKNNIISLEDAMDIYAENVFANEFWTDYPAYYIIVNITDINLGMKAIEKDGKNVLVPVYEIKSTRGYETVKNSFSEEKRFAYGDYILYINAIDGSIIE